MNLKDNILIDFKIELEILIDEEKNRDYFFNDISEE
jgi:hypothetical protein